MSSLKIRQFLRERLRGLFVSGNGQIEYPATFREELNEQCGRVIFLAALIAALSFISFIPIDRQLFPDEPHG